MILSVNLYHTDRLSLVRWLNRRRLDWPQVHEPLGWSSPLASRFGVEALPWTVVYGKDGRLVGTDSGAVERALAPPRREASAMPPTPGRRPRRALHADDCPLAPEVAGAQCRLSRRPGSVRARAARASRRAA